jgi:LPXTG-motif cell wall-anchored protein
MRTFLNILAILLVLVGVVWFLQGINVLLGSVMTGQPQWTLFGIIAFLIGVALLLFSNRRKHTPPESN